MFREINDLENYYDTVILTPLDNNLLTMMRKLPEHATLQVMLYFYRMIAINVQYMYLTIVKMREGVG